MSVREAAVDLDGVLVLDGGFLELALLLIALAALEVFLFLHIRVMFAAGCQGQQGRSSQKGKSAGLLSTVLQESFLCLHRGPERWVAHGQFDVCRIFQRRDISTSSVEKAETERLRRVFRVTDGANVCL